MKVTQHMNMKVMITHIPVKYSESRGWLLKHRKKQLRNCTCYINHLSNRPQTICLYTYRSCHYPTRDLQGRLSLIEQGVTIKYKQEKFRVPLQLLGLVQA